MDTVDPGVTEVESPPAESPTPDRPIQNVVGEFNRKFGALDAKLNQLSNVLLELAQTKSAPAPTVGAKSDRSTMSDDELWELAKAGDKDAFDLHQERKAQRVYDQRRSVESETQLVDAQLNALYTKYPVLSNPQHPLAQTTNMAYALYLKRGKPADRSTLLLAAKDAIADRPDLVAELHTQGARARESSRRVAADNPGMTGATFRQDEPASNAKFRVSPQEAALARRMGVADPAKAKERFVQRQNDGRSNLGAVGALVREEDF